jgi:hypothetical protein
LKFDAKPKYESLRGLFEQIFKDKVETKDD